ncbi:MAG: hypothetical protein V3S05_00795 [Desulfobacterales bacterium]
MQSSDWIGIAKNAKKGGQAGLETEPKAFWAIPVRFPALHKGKSTENGQTDTRDSFLGAVTA